MTVFQSRISNSSEAFRQNREDMLSLVASLREIEDYVYNMAREISHMAPLSIAALKQQILDITNTSSLSAEMVAESDKRAATILSSNDFREGISALKSKRHPKFHGQ